MKLIVNADDLGISRAVNYGIYDAFHHGCVTSTSLMTNMPAVEHAIWLFKKSKIGIGVHLNVSLGKSLLNHKNLTDDSGSFRGPEHHFDSCLDEIEAEYEAQIERAYALGIEVSHLDSHHHLHMRIDAVYDITKRLAEKYDLPMRFDDCFQKRKSLVKTTSAFLGTFFDRNVKLDYLTAELVKLLAVESLEIMVHPGFLDGSLKALDSYRDMRTKEHGILISQDFRDYLSKHHVQMINYREL